MLNRKIMCVAATVALSIGACSQPSIAEATTAPMSGGITIDIPPNTQKSMLTLNRENVTMDIFPNRCITTARFQITNLGRPITVDLGFPTRDLGGTDFYKVEGWLNGKGMKSKRKAFQPKWGEVGPSKTGPGWIVWSVHFPFSEPQYIDVAYETKPTPATALNYGFGQIEDSKYKSFIEANDLHHVRYVMYSKDVWKGPIGVTDIQTKMHKPFSKENVIIAARHMASDRSKVRWHFDNLYDNDRPKLGLNSFEPHEVSFDFSPTHSRSEVMTAARRELEKDPQDPYMTAFLGECYATDNRRDEKLKLYANFLSSNTKYLAEYARTHNDVVRDLVVETCRLSDELKSPETIKQNRYALLSLLRACLAYEKQNAAEPRDSITKAHIWRMESWQQRLAPARVARWERRR